MAPVVPTFSSSLLSHPFSRPSQSRPGSLRGYDSLLSLFLYIEELVRHTIYTIRQLLRNCLRPFSTAIRISMVIHPSWLVLSHRVFGFRVLEHSHYMATANIIKPQPAPRSPCKIDILLQRQSPVPSDRSCESRRALFLKNLLHVLTLLVHRFEASM
jgi:hypothetical protein